MPARTPREPSSFPGEERWSSGLVGDALTAWKAGIDAVDPAACVEAALAARSGFSAPTLAIAAGKAAAGMMRGALPFLGARTRSFVLLPHGTEPLALPASTAVLRGGHPHPTNDSFRSTRAILAEVDRLRDGDTLLFLVSGGASALLEAPAAGLAEDDLVRSHEVLVASGLAIADINLVRGCLSDVKAGRLAARAGPARIVTLAISDVEGDDPRAIGSGPTVAPLLSGQAAAARALEILGRREVALPARAKALLERRAREDAGAGRRSAAGDVTVVASIAHATRAAREQLVAGGFRVAAAAEYLRGQTDACVERVLHALDGMGAAPARAAVLGGETTVRIGERTTGRGGRNLDLAARIALAISGRRGLVVVVAGTDGCDGSSRAAGAVVDGGSAARAAGLGFPFEAALAAFDTEPALDASGGLLVTGPTGTNVGDLVVVAERREEP